MESNLYRRNFLLYLQERASYEQPILLKEPAREPPTRLHLNQLYNEYAITTQLANVTGVRPALAMEGSESRPVLLLEYIQGQPLAELIYSTSLDLAEKLQLAVNVATVLGHIHEQQVMHKDINPGNILVANNDKPGSQDGLYIIDFGLASITRQENPSQLAPDDTLIGTLAYISPEQTGRMNRQVDYRTDLYSLGVTLYELFTGQLPFESGDALSMIHDHIARQPQSPHQIDAGIPGPVSDIILKLLVKNAEDRYQTAHGLQVDLEICLEQWQSEGRIEPFELGGDDFTGRLQIPQKLYGRLAEIEQLQTILDGSTTGLAQLVLVAGYSGVGKTSLVHEIQKDVIAQEGFFIEGKFDQIQRTLPYSAWEQAFNQLVDNWLKERETSLAGWRNTILDAIGDQGQVLIEVIPSLKRILGPQPEVPQLGGIENQNRFNYTFNRFISSLATPDHPLVVFLDDLQWIDPASLNLIETLLAVQATSSFLIIGAYRDNEVGAGHPLLVFQERMQAKSDLMTSIALGDLAPDSINHLLADTLQLTVADCRDLSQVLVEKTAGNPFFTRQLLYALESEGLLRFERERRRWVWDDVGLQDLEALGSVVDLMIGKLQALPDETQHALSMAACLGSRFETSTLDTIIGQPQSDILTALNPALQGGLVVRSNGQYMFSHDRIQEAGYALIHKSDLPKKHLEIGRLLLADTADDDLDEQLFFIVGHLNAGRALIDIDSEKLDLARLNLMAGQKAKAASAFADAKEYIEIGLDLLGPDNWQNQYELTLSLHNEYGELAALTGHYDQVYSAANPIHANAKTILDQARIFITTIDAEVAQYNFPKALEIGRDILNSFGIEIPMQPGPEDIQHQTKRFLTLLKSKPKEELANLPNMSDESAIAASTILASLMAPAYISNPPLFPIVGLQGAILTLEYGLDAWSPLFFLVHPMMIVASVDHRTSVEDLHGRIVFVKQSLEIVRQMLSNPVTIRGRTKTLQSTTMISPWVESIDKTLEVLRDALQSSFEYGDLRVGTSSITYFTFLGFAAGLNLDVYQNELLAYKVHLNSEGQKTTLDWLSIYLQTAQNFKEDFPEPHKLIGTHFNEDDWLPGAQAANDVAGLDYFHTNKLVLMFHFDMDDQLDEYTADIENFLAGRTAMFTTPLVHLYLALARLRLIGASGPEGYEESMNLVNNSLRWMENWSQSVPSTFQHKYDLIAAEKARATGDLEGALTHYEQAIAGARENGFIHEEALANELYARFWAERGNDRFAGLFMREAHSVYQKWGALAKAEHLAKRYPNWLIGRSIVVDEPGTQIISNEMTGNLDLLTILSASQAIAVEIELNHLLDLMMTIVMENAGAQLGYLLLEQDGQWVIATQADVDETEPQVKTSIPIDESVPLSQGIVHYVARTQQTVLLGDASQTGDFVEDPHVKHHEVKSLLCTALVNRGKTSAILYLENNLSSGAFTPERVELLRLLSSQMAISIDNARIHNQLEGLLEERSKALASAEAQIRTLFEKSPLGIALSSFEGKPLTVNQALLDMLRISEEELLQRKVTDFYANPGDRAALLNRVQASGSVQDFGVQLVRNDGTSFFANLNMSRLILEGNDVLLAMVEDVTAQIVANQKTATLEERERLARDLHDSVTQTLYSAGMIANATQRKWEEGRTLEQRDLELLPVLIRGAAAEMRTLLLELRPDVIKHQTLGKLLELLADSARARTHAQVSLKVEDDRQLPEEVTLALHRIAQESLNNVGKHAEASQIVIELTGDAQDATLSIKDDGRGFDPLAIPAGHLGLMIMSERAQKIGADIEIDSKPGQGTVVVVAWSAGSGGA